VYNHMFLYYNSTIYIFYLHLLHLLLQNLIVILTLLLGSCISVHMCIVWYV